MLFREKSQDLYHQGCLWSRMVHKRSHSWDLMINILLVRASHISSIQIKSVPVVTNLSLNAKTVSRWKSKGIETTPAVIAVKIPSLYGRVAMKSPCRLHCIISRNFTRAFTHSMLSVDMISLMSLSSLASWSPEKDVFSVKLQDTFHHDGVFSIVMGNYRC